MKATFEVEWPDDLGESWMNNDNLMACIAAYCKGVDGITVETPAKTQAVNIIFDGPPSHESGRFVETETDDGKGVGCGEWIERDDGYWVLRITSLPEVSDGTG